MQMNLLSELKKKITKKGKCGAKGKTASDVSTELGFKSRGTVSNWILQKRIPLGQYERVKKYLKIKL
jgi:hypothetical protein